MPDPTITFYAYASGSIRESGDAVFRQAKRAAGGRSPLVQQDGQADLELRGIPARVIQSSL